MKTILLATAVSVALVGQAMPANAQETKTEYDPNDPFFGVIYNGGFENTPAIGAAAIAYTNALDELNDAALSEQSAQQALTAAIAAVVTPGQPTQTEQDAIDAANKSLNDAKTRVEIAETAVKDAHDDYLASGSNYEGNARAIAQTANDLRGENGLVDQEIIVETGVDDDPETEEDESKETIVRKGRVTVNEEDIDSNTSNIEQVTATISKAFEGFDAAAVNSTLKQVDTNKAAIAHNSSRLDTVEGEIDGLKSGVAMAIAIANAPIISNGTNKFSLSGGVGYYDEAVAMSLKGAFMPRDNIAITGSLAYDFEEDYALGIGAGIAF